MLERFKQFFQKEEVRTTESEFEAILTEREKQQVVVHRNEAMNIPAVSTCVEFISSTIAGLPVKFYKNEDGKITEVENDYRLKLLNAETGDLLDAEQWKKSIIIDYLLDGNGYSYVNKKRNKIVSLNYVPTSIVSTVIAPDPVFKDADFYINGVKYPEYNVFRLLRCTEDGVTGIGVLEQHPLLFRTMYNALKYENNAISYGTKRGFLQSKYRLAEEAMTSLKEAWKKLYSTDANNAPDVMVLNEGITFEPASSTAVENQMDESKKSNSDLVYNIFNLSSALFASANSANVDNDVYLTCVKMGILPIVKALNVAINKFLLLEGEKKDGYFFVIDTSEILKASLVDQFQAYDIGLKGGWLQVDEVRKRENMTPLGLDFVKLSLADVLYYPNSKEVYTANTNSTYTIGQGNAGDQKTNGNADINNQVVKGGEEDNENRT